MRDYRKEPWQPGEELPPVDQIVHGGCWQVSIRPDVKFGSGIRWDLVAKHRERLGLTEKRGIIKDA